MSEQTPTRNRELSATTPVRLTIPQLFAVLAVFAGGVLWVTRVEYHLASIDRHQAWQNRAIKVLLHANHLAVPDEDASSDIITTNP